MRSASPRNQRGRDRHLGGAIASEIRWGFGKVPTIQNVEILRVADQFASPATAALLQNHRTRRSWKERHDHGGACSTRSWHSLPRGRRSAHLKPWRVRSTQMWRHSHDSHRHGSNCGNIGGVFSQWQSLASKHESKHRACAGIYQRQPDRFLRDQRTERGSVHSD